MNAGKEIWSEFWKNKNSWIWIMEFTPTYKSITKLFRTVNLPQDAKILDAGCGTGKLASFWLKKGYNILGVDTSSAALDLTNKRGVEVLEADIVRGLPFDDNTFDLVYSDGLLEHFEDPIPVLSELFRVSCTYVLTIVPRICLLKDVIDFVVPPPKEYKMVDSEWIRLHYSFKLADVSVMKCSTALCVLCKKT